ncbi:MAG TPA: vWA domain-containing protein, partial [Myxococcaceae bacterium]|nr:vWA domain-containing protein [Myxococcaceae bacterium]
KMLEVWKSIKRSADVALAFDKSGSMAGRPLEQAKAGAKAFFDNLQDQDQVTLMFFDHNIYPPIGPQTLAKGRSDLLSRIEAISAGGGTALYDAVAQAYRDAQERGRKDPSRIRAVVVMTDGRDEHSRLRFPDLQRLLSSEDSSIKVFTIAYGASADLDVLNRIAEVSKGSSAKGTAETIVQVYQDIAAFF